MESDKGAEPVRLKFAPQEVSGGESERAILRAKEAEREREREREREGAITQHNWDENFYSKHFKIHKSLKNKKNKKIGFQCWKAYKVGWKTVSLNTVSKKRQSKYKKWVLLV